MDFLRKTCCLVLITALLAVLGCTPSPDADRAAQNQTDSQRKSAKDLTNVKLTLLVIDDVALADSISQLRGQWQAATGGTFEVRQASLVDLIVDDPLPGDAVLYPAELLAELAERDRLLPLSPTALKDTELAWPDVFESLRSRQAQWGMKTVAIPFGTPQLVCLYRADLFEKFNRQPPATWGEYLDLAEFFADRTKLGDAAPAADKDWSGTLEPFGDYWASTMLLAHAAAYAQHPNHYSALFNMETMEPLIASPPFVRALEELVKANRGSEGKSFKSTPQEVCQAFLRGESAMALTWPMATASDHEKKNEKEGSKPNTEARWGIAALPGSREVYSPGKKVWEDRRDGVVSHVPLLGTTGRLGSVAAKSSHADAATHLLAWLNGPRWSARICSVSAATAPFRDSHRRSAVSWTAPELAGVASDYFDIVRNDLKGEQAMMALNLTARDCYLFVLDRAVREALQGKQSAAEALESTAEAWREVIQRRGLKLQRQAYQRSLGLEP